MSRREQVLLAALLLALWPAAAWGQFGRSYADLAMMQGGGGPAISAAGASTVKRKPTQLRMYVQLLAKGKTLEDALAKLKERREAAATQLETLKVDKKSIVFGSPSLSNVQSARKRQIEAMVMEQMRSRGKTPKGLQAPQTVTVSATLTAGWPLEAETHEQLLLLAQGIQDKIKAGDLAGSKEAEKLSPEEEELAEEAAKMSRGYGEETPQPGQPQFVFVAVLSKEAREKAMTEAFAKAKAQAADVAKAAGVGLGPLLGVSGNCAGQSNFGDNEYARYGVPNPYGNMRQLIAQQTGEDPNETQNEAMSTDPGTLAFTCYVMATFGLGK